MTLLIKLAGYGTSTLPNLQPKPDCSISLEYPSALSQQNIYHVISLYSYPAHSGNSLYSLCRLLMVDKSREMRFSFYFCTAF